MKYFIDTEFIEGTQSRVPLIVKLANIFSKAKPTIDLISIGIVSEDYDTKSKYTSETLYTSTRTIHPGREYYAISKDFNLKEAWYRYDLKPNAELAKISPELRQQKLYNNHYNAKLGYEKDYWIRDNVLKPIYRELIELECGKIDLAIKCRTEYKTPYKGEFCYKTFKYLLNKYGKTNKQISREVKEFCTCNETMGNGILEQVVGFKDTIDREIKFYGYYSDYDWVAFCWLFGKMIDLPNGFPKYCIDVKQILDDKALLIFYTKEYYPDRKLIYPKDFNISIEELPNYPKKINSHNALSDARWIKELYNFLKTI